MRRKKPLPGITPLGAADNGNTQWWGSNCFSDITASKEASGRHLLTAKSGSQIVCSQDYWCSQGSLFLTRIALCPGYMLPLEAIQ